MKIGIIGGSGKTGKQFIGFFSKNNIEVISIGRQTENYRDAVESCDVLILTVPINSVKDIVQKISEFDIGNKLILNFSSIMSHGWKELEEVCRNVVCVHPMFGPDVMNFEGQNIVVAPKIENEDLKEIVKVFEMNKANVNFSSIEEHDKLMATVQALSQFSSITLASALSHQEFSIDKLRMFSSITFRMNLGAIERIIKQDSELWRNIEFLNPYFEETLLGYEKEFLKLRNIVKNKDSEGFDDNFNDVRDEWKKGVMKEAPKEDQTVLIIDPKEDRVGLLLDILEVFKKNNVNLSEISSKNSKTQFGTYIFKIVVDTTDDILVDKLISELEGLNIEVEKN